MVFTAPAGLEVGDQHEFEFSFAELQAAPLASETEETDLLEEICVVVINLPVPGGQRFAWTVVDKLMVFTAPAGLHVGDEHEFEFTEEELEAAPLAAVISDHDKAILEIDRVVNDRVARIRSERLERARRAAKAKRAADLGKLRQRTDHLMQESDKLMQQLMATTDQEEGQATSANPPSSPLAAVALGDDSATPAAKGLRRADAFARRPAAKKDERAERAAAAEGPMGASEMLSVPSRTKGLRRADAFARGRSQPKLQPERAQVEAPAELQAELEPGVQEEALLWLLKSEVEMARNSKDSLEAEDEPT